MKWDVDPEDNAGELAERVLRAFEQTAEGVDAQTRLRVLERVQTRVAEEISNLSTIEEKIRRHTRQIPEVRDVDRLRELHATLNDLAVQLFESDRSVPELLALCTEYRDRLFVRVLHLMEEDLGPPPCAYAAGSLGSEGREEQTLLTDQDNMLVFQDAGARDYFREFGRRVNETLDRVGVRRCSGKIMMGEERWQGTFEDWQDRIDRTFAFRGEDQDHRQQLLDLVVLSDLRFIAGKRALLQRVASHFFGRMFENVPVLYDMATACVSMPVGIGLFGRFRTDKSGKNQGKFSIKLLGWAPLILAVRILALRDNIYETNTLRRIEALRIHHRIDETFETELIRAYTLLTRLKIEAQIRSEDNDPHDVYYIDPEQLAPDRREALKETLHTVQSLQKLAYAGFMFNN